MLLEKFKCGKENGVYNAGTTHRYTNSSVHSSIEKLYFWCRLRLPDLMREAVSLIDRLSRIYWIDEKPADSPT